MKMGFPTRSTRNANPKYVESSKKSGSSKSPHKTKRNTNTSRRAAKKKKAKTSGSSNWQMKIKNELKVLLCRVPLRIHQRQEVPNEEAQLNLPKEPSSCDIDNEQLATFPNTEEERSVVTGTVSELTALLAVPPASNTTCEPSSGNSPPVEHERITFFASPSLSDLPEDQDDENNLHSADSKFYIEPANSQASDTSDANPSLDELTGKVKLNPKLVQLYGGTDHVQAYLNAKLRRRPN